MKIVFLDCDGVVNSHLFGEQFPEKDKEHYVIDERCVKLLNELSAATWCKFVISSAWRNTLSIEEIRKLFAAKGFTGDIIDVTPRLGHGNLRGNEILQWMKEHEELIGSSYSEYKEYVIFDDDSDMLLWQQYNFIKTDIFCGLTPNNCYKAKYILLSKYS